MPGKNRRSVLDLNPDAAILFNTRRHHQVALTVAAAVHVFLPALTIGGETPQVGETDKLLAVNGTLASQMRPLVGTAGLCHARDAGH